MEAVATAAADAIAVTPTATDTLPTDTQAVAVVVATHLAVDMEEADHMAVEEAVATVEVPAATGCPISVPI